MSLKKIKIHSTELSAEDAELVDSILIDVLQQRGIELYSPDTKQDSFAWEIEVVVMTKLKEV